jgi:hypothetical protein
MRAGPATLLTSLRASISPSRIRPSTSCAACRLSAAAPRRGLRRSMRSTQALARTIPPQRASGSLGGAPQANARIHFTDEHALRCPHLAVRPADRTSDRVRVGTSQAQQGLSYLIRTGLAFYFATPYHSWERGTNENTNGLIRQYLPKRTSMVSLSQAECNAIASRLNQRPRKRYDYATPLEVLDYLSLPRLT